MKICIKKSIFHTEMKMNKNVIFTFDIPQYFWGYLICYEEITAR